MTDPASSARATGTYAWLVFGLVFGLMLSNSMSRQVATVVFPYLKEAWQLSDTRLGSLMSVVSLTVGVLTLPVSLLADRHGRVPGVTLMALLWGCATIACGMAGNFLVLLGARFLLGAAQAGFGSAGGAILMGVFPPRLHSTVMGAFVAGGLFGSVLGVAIGGVLASHFGWRAAFFVTGGVALLLALLFRAVVREVQGSAHPDAHGEAARLSLADVARELFAARTAVFVYLGCGLQMFTVGATLAWIPSYLNRYYGMGTTEAGMKAGLLVLLSAAGMVLGGAVVDRLARGKPARRLVVTAAYAGTSAVLLFAAFGQAPGMLQFSLLGLGMLLSGAHSGPSGAIATEVNDPRIRATVLATIALAMSLLGLAPGPFVTGMLADASDLGTAMRLMPVASVLACACFVLSTRHYAVDSRRFPQAPDSGVEARGERATGPAAPDGVAP